ncbi:hypothetical protein HPC49_40620 [Pyxidicoccus fallax]|uniref:Uncharacterized protein n=1 Tax=Pyxidicoccus fallax TaxID=394095 RepID=A0A848LMM6_9BACT|nr:hypothetical protein [Pyxidicoccus fallax]NMO18834.1 hypothetical protein [Pyxidicoccus fallax]NPC84506.1 hypothetical protein [Pyxidicoccus fallax]
MDTADTRLRGLALAWLTTRLKRPGTRKELEGALAPFVEHRLSRAEWKARFDTLLEGLLHDELVAERGRSGLTLTAQGRSEALAFLQLETLPRGLTWKKLKATYLLALGLDLEQTKAVRERLASADGVRAAVLKREHPVEDSDVLSLAQMRDRLLWRQLGVETERPFTLAAVQAHLLGQLLDTETKDPRKAVEQLAARAAGATRVDAEAVRLALLRQWAMAEPGTSPAPEETPAPASEAESQDSVASFAERVLAVARALPTGRFGQNKVFISHVWKALQPEWSSREAFDVALLEANRTRHLSLTRADLVSAMDPRDVAESEVRSYGASFHFVVV